MENLNLVLLSLLTLITIVNVTLRSEVALGLSLMTLGCWIGQSMTWIALDYRSSAALKITGIVIDTVALVFLIKVLLRYNRSSRRNK